MNNWIDVKEKYPDHEQKVVIKIFDEISKLVCEVEAQFNDYEDYRGWEIKKEKFEGKKFYARPTHWKPISEGQNE